MKYLLLLALALFHINVDAQGSVGVTKTEIIYGRKDGMALTMVMFAPKQNANGKAVIDVISGGWNSGYYLPWGIPSDARSRRLLPLEKGYTIFFVITSSQPRYAIPDMIDDVKRAVRFIRYNANDYHINPNHIGITGESAGGHLSLMVGLSDDKKDSASNDPVESMSSRVQAIAVFYPPTDFLNWGSQNTNVLSFKSDLARANLTAAFDFKEWDNNIKMYVPVTDSEARVKITRQISPIYSVTPDDPPVLIIQGDADPSVPLQQAETIIKRLNEAGVSDKLIIKKGGGHGWQNQEVEEKFIVDWFNKYL